MEFSSFGKSFSSDAGIVQLMDDLGNALSVDERMLMLGGGNPGQIPEVQARFRKRMHAHCRKRLPRFKIPQKVELAEASLHGGRFKKLRAEP